MNEDKTGFETEDDTAELDLGDGDGVEDLEGVMREAVAAVSEVENQRGRGADAPSPAGEAGGEEEAGGDGEVEELRREIADLRDRTVRTLADFDNFRKRARREQQEARRYALAEPFRALLDVVDNLERALAADGSLEDLKAGVELILRQLHDLLKSHGVTPVEAEGQAFDPNLHEAVAREEAPGLDEPKVAAELQRGYRLHERLLRPSRVAVAVPAERES